MTAVDCVTIGLLLFIASQHLPLHTGTVVSALTGVALTLIGAFWLPFELVQWLGGAP